MNPATAALLLLFPLLTACGGSDQSAAADQAALSGTPTAFALQFAGTYLGSGTLSRLELHPDGTFVARHAGGTERAHFAVARGKTLPLALHLGGRLALDAEIGAYDGVLHVGGQQLKLQRPARSDEDLCDGSGGKWTDDDPDPRTGLYCVCPAPAAFIPAAGGCIAVAVN